MDPTQAQARRQLFLTSQRTPNPHSCTPNSQSRMHTHQEWERDQDGQDKRELIRMPKIQYPKDAMEALRLLQKELDAQLAKLEGEKEATSSRHRRRASTPQSRSRPHRSGDLSRNRSRRRSHSKDSSKGRTRFDRREQVTSLEYMRDRCIPSPQRRNPTPLRKR